MPTRKHQLNIAIDPSAAASLETVAKHVMIERTRYAALVLQTFSQLKPEHALDALTAIPKQFFKGRPGRPSSTAHSSDANSPALAQNTA